MILIAAVANNGVIGSRNGLPWHEPEDYRQYLAFVAGQTVILGRTSFEIFGPDLTSAHNLVLTRSETRLDGATCFADLNEAMAHAKTLGRAVFCAGGAQIYKLAMPHASWLFLSHIQGNYDGDARFPEIDPARFEAVETRHHPTFDFIKYRRLHPA